MRLRTTAFAAVAAAAMGLSACATSPRADELAIFDAPETAERNATLRVTNNNWSDMTVYVVRAGMRTRIGRISSMSTSEFRIPAGVLTSAAPMQLMAVPLASRRGYVSQNVSIVPGQRVSLQLENNLNLSTFTVR